MPLSQLLQLVKDEDFDGFETLCLETLESGDLKLADLVGPFKELDNREHADRAAAIGQMVLENVDAESDPKSALEIARYAVLGDPKNEDLLKRATALYRRVYGETPGFEALMTASGLESGRPVRNALRLLDVCLSAKPGDPMLSRTEDAVVEVMDLDFEHGLITLRTQKRPKTVTPMELSREYERVAPDDFRVLIAFKPESVTELLEKDPIGIVTAILHAHGEMMDQDVLKSELTPKYLPAKAWSKWWTSVKAKLKRNPHVIMEGRNPVLLRYTAETWTLEDAAWEEFNSRNDPGEWRGLLDNYVREKQKHKEGPDVGLLAKCKVKIERHRETILHLRPSEALACSLVGAKIDKMEDGLGEPSAPQALEMLKVSKNPAKLIRGIPDEILYADALGVLEEARPEDAAHWAAELAPSASAVMLDRLTEITRKADATDLIQSHIDAATADPVEYTEIIYWLWKGPKSLKGLRDPDYDALFTTIILTLRALGRTLNPDPEVTKQFRLRIRTALSLKSYERAKQCIQHTTHGRAITLRTQLERLEGLGDNVRYKLIALLRDQHPAVFVVKRRRIEAWEDETLLWNTAAGIKRKTEERDHLVNVEMHENAKRIGEAASHGDLSENSEYKFALEERDFLRGRLAQMNAELSISEELSPHSIPTDHVGVGSRVTLRDAADGETRVMTFLGPFDTDVDNGVFNYRAPVSQLLMGAKLGERRELTFDEKSREYEIVEISKGLQ